MREPPSALAHRLGVILQLPAESWPQLPDAITGSGAHSHLSTPGQWCKDEHYERGKLSPSVEKSGYCSQSEGLINGLKPQSIDRLRGATRTVQNAGCLCWMTKCPPRGFHPYSLWPHASVLRHPLLQLSKLVSDQLLWWLVVP